MAADTTSDAGLSAREQIAFTIIKWSGAGLAILAVVIVGFALVQAFATDRDDQSQDLILTVFNAILPLLGTWVGTVIAFYFTRENFVSAAQESRRLVQAMTDEKLKSIPVAEVMLKRDAFIDAVTLASGAAEDSVKTKDLLASVQKPKVSRVPILGASGEARYVLHDSMIYKDSALHGVTVGSPARDRTLADMLAISEFAALFKAIATVPRRSSLADAKSRMESVPNCRDVFVTETGAATEPVLGWVTDRDIAVHATA